MDLDELVLLERIDLIARLSAGEKSNIKDQEVALMWISELAEEIRYSYIKKEGASKAAFSYKI
ncbi:TPA: hypothetical protein RM800_002087 [Yersinia enterocolitica]|nr:hypothetical protein [Yersinia enterocolitica]HEN3568044.1 hypothetical protein [Yersinia enterocolitica]HEN3569412.1 hypothetical protein [Yersinia enterocolitica]HEN3575595.1 hypothetical protein [Yersinia enterocolitica]HEN3651377.1 hypothetical protein [Yersinia enterocolitica]